MMAENDNAKTVAGEIIEAPQADVLAVLSSAEIDVQITTAKRYPRSITKFREDALTLATIDQETAESCRYCLPRSGKTIEGPSIRLAEISATCWGNLRYGARPIKIEAKTLTSQGVCWDLETNTAAQWEVTRRITDRNGMRYSEDMITTTANAACAIAAREAIFKVIPKALIKPVYEAARQLAIGDAKSLVSRRTIAVDWFRNVGVMPERVLAVLGKQSLDDVTLDDLGILSGLKTAIRDGDTTIEQAFPPTNGSAPMDANGDAEKRTEELRGRIDADGKEEPISRPAPKPPPPPNETTTEGRPPPKVNKGELFEDEWADTRLRLMSMFRRVPSITEAKAALKRAGIADYDKLRECKDEQLLGRANAELNDLLEADNAKR